MVPCLGDDAGRFDQNTVQSERWIELDQKFWLDTEKFRAVAVAFLDAALGVAAIAAHVPFARGTAGTRYGIWTAHNADHEIAAVEAAIHWSVLHRAERLVANHEALAAGRRPAIQAGNDIAIGPANAERQTAHQHGAV